MAPPPIIGVAMTYLGGYYFGGIFTGVQRAAYQRGYQVLALKGRPCHLVAMPIARDIVQGWVLIHDSEGMEQLARQGLPFVSVATHVLGLERPAVLADNFGGTRAAVRHLIDHEGERVSRKAMLAKVWGLHEDTDTRAIDNFIVRLRKHLEDLPSQPRHLVTVRGIGYRFIAHPQVDA